MQLAPTSRTSSSFVFHGSEVYSVGPRRESNGLSTLPSCPLRRPRQLDSPEVGVIENDDATPNNLDRGMLRVNEQIRYQKKRDKTE